jgi:23S rRNA pseudouridine1911/1915/1917 synthase
LAVRRVSRRSIANPPAGPPTGEAPAEFRSHALSLPAELRGLRFDQALARALPQYSRAQLQAWIESGAVQTPGRTLRGRDRVRGGEEVQLRAQLRARIPAVPEALPLDIIFRDRALIVLNKPAGLVVHPGAGNPCHTLLNALLALDPKLALVPRAGLVHRLDRDTSGLLAVARTPEAHAALVAALAAREISRHYLAICTGVMTGGGTIDEPIGRHRTQRVRMAVRRDGRRAVTHYRVLRRFRAHTEVSIELETGRTHQIRVHLAHAGFPIVGDRAYGGRRRASAGCTPALAAELAAFPRQALHAARLALKHPISRREMHWEAPLPEDMHRLLATLEADQRPQ